MATDPAVQAAADVIENWIIDVGVDWWPDTENVGELVVAAVTPLIRAQAFTEAADKLQSRRDNHGDPDCRECAGIGNAIGVVRGLSEETENA